VVYKEIAGSPPVINLSYDKPTNRGPAVHAGQFAVAAYLPQHPGPFYVLNDTGAVKRPE
jgi:hypothetical protein